MASCLTITAIICVLITAVATIVAFSTPNWIEFDDSPGNGDMLCLCPTCDCGLWLTCSAGAGSLNNCEWFLGNEYRIEKELPDWFKAVQGLMSVAIASVLLSLIIALFSLCCQCKSCNPHHAVAAFINLTFLLIAISVCIFGAYAYKNHNTVVIPEQHSTDPIFGWSFWTAVGAGAAALFSSILYFCVSRSDEYRYIYN